ncbi:MAG: M2 family metallopeptidase [Acidobacteriota bacterium]
MACGETAEETTDTPGPPPPSVSEAAAFVDRAESELETFWIRAERAAWVKQNFITQDTEAIEAEAEQAMLARTADLAVEAAQFNGLELPDDVARKLKLLRTSLPLAAPRDAAKQAELARISAELSSLYGAGEYCPPGGGPCQTLDDLTRIMSESRQPDELLDAWTHWRSVSPPMREKYRRFVELGNEGARLLGFSDLGEMWRSGYDMPAADFPGELDRLWDQVRPLYDALHCHVRAKLAAFYGTDVVPPTGPLPAHLLGNMWAQSWSHVYDLVAPPATAPAVDLTRLLRARQVGPLEMVRFGERFFTSLGFEPLPATFWDRSLFTRPQDRDVVCHASAWDIDMQDDLRIKVCLEVNAEDFRTIHHELGHNFYQRAYRNQPPLFRSGANDGFHEGIGDTIALSITPEYLARIGLLARAPSASDDLGFLMRMALDKVAFLPFGLMIDQWRWGVFSGDIAPEQYNAAWWRLRRKYQGIQAPLARSEADFDPGAKYHVPANTPYTRYFLAHILQFQFHRALCKAAGYSGPLDQCSIYDNPEAGRRLEAMLEMGQSRPWPEALAVLTGSREMDATAILEYFAPLKTWLDEQNAERSCGW